MRLTVTRVRHGRFRKSSVGRPGILHDPDELWREIKESSRLKFHSVKGGNLSTEQREFKPSVADRLSSIFHPRLGDGISC